MAQSQDRIAYADFNAAVPGVGKGLALLTQAAEKGGVDKQLLELVKLRASQINGCAFCVQYHLNVARKLGVPQVKFDLLAAWHDAGVFSERERAALLWTEALTTIAGRGVSDEIYAEVARAFPGEQIAHLTAAVAAINAWNRIGISMQFAPPIEQAE